MAFALVDTHTHLNSKEFNESVAEVVGRAVAEGVRQMLVVGIDRASSERAVEIASQYAEVFAVVGIQPNSAHQATEADWKTILEMAAHPKSVALGETGLDRYWDHCPFDVQQRWFQLHLEQAAKSEMPFVVHCREAEADVLAMLKEAGKSQQLRGIMHSYAGDMETALVCVELGMHVSFAGMVTFKKSDALREVAAAIPADRLLIETDCPYLSPEPKRGKFPNEPARVRHTLDCLAVVRGVSSEELAQQTTQNARRLLGLPEPNLE
ncbi:D-aminoacyl-tRNA deacylase [Planctomycetales bacterium 10988]|nr:D-aminoacyl-tRNA deacylase [Planctomycetales bacterium 10988]